MNRTLFLATIASMLVGCAADFSEDDTGGTTMPPESSEQTTGEPTVNVYGARLQRPAETIGSVEEAEQTANARAIRNYVETVDQAEMDLGPKFNRSSTQ